MMPMRGSRPYLIRRHRRRVTIVAWAVLLLIALLAVGIFVALRNADHFCKFRDHLHCLVMPRQNS